MHRFVSLAAVMAATAAPAGAAPIKLTPAVQRNVQCFLLFAIAADQASEAKDDKKQEGTALGLTFFMGKLAVAAPGLDLAAAVQQEADAFKANAHAKEIGESCDAEFSKMGQQLRDLGSTLQKPQPAATPAPPPK